MKNRSAQELLADMLGFARQAMVFAGSASLDDFANDAKSQFAIMHALQFLGEAAKSVPEDIRQAHGTIPWSGIIGMRNIVAHNYLGADPAVIFDTVSLDLPPLIEALEKALRSGP